MTRVMAVPAMTASEYNRRAHPSRFVNVIVDVDVLVHLVVAGSRRSVHSFFTTRRQRAAQAQQNKEADDVHEHVHVNVHGHRCGTAGAPTMCIRLWDCPERPFMLQGGMPRVMAGTAMTAKLDDFVTFCSHRMDLATRTSNYTRQRTAYCVVVLLVIVSTGCF